MKLSTSLAMTACAGTIRNTPAGLPVAVEHAVGTALEQVGPQIAYIGRSLIKLPGQTPTVVLGFTSLVLFHEGDFPDTDAECYQVTVTAPVEKLLSQRLRHLALETAHII